MKSCLRVLGLLLICVFISCKGQSSKKINGVSFVASGDSITMKHVNPVLQVNANSAAIMPFGFIRDLAHPKVQYSSERQWFGETPRGVKQYAGMLQKNGVSIMVKPQIWVWHGEFTGNIKMNSEADWKILEDTYKKFILEFAVVAQEIKAETFCIGTELEQFIKHRPNYWSELISEIRKVYKGKLTYAANWDEFTRTPFWEQLDYIGIDAYFPLSDEKTPSIAALTEGWKKHKQTILNHSNKFKKPILFTEFGYRSLDFTGDKPWDVDHSKTAVNLEGQANALQVIFDTFWHEEWFAGGYVWKWFIDHEKVGGKENARFTPQNKPAELVIKDFYGGTPKKKN